MNLRQLKLVLLQTLLLPILAAGLLAGALAWQLLNAQRAVHRIELIDTNISTATLATALMLDEDAGIRSYQITENEIFLQPYDLARVPLSANLITLRSGLLGQQPESDDLASFRAAHARWVVSIAEPIIAAVASGRDTRDPGLNLRAKAQSDNMQYFLGAIVQNQQRRRVGAAEHWEWELRRTVTSLIGSALIGGLLIGLFAHNRLHKVSEAFQAALTALRGHAQATYDSEQRLRTVLVSLADAVVVCDLTGGITLMNPAAERLSGWSENEATKHAFEEVFPLQVIEGSSAAPSPLTTLGKDERTALSAQSLSLVRRDRTEFLVDQNGARLHDKTGVLAGIVLVLHDVTQQRRTQAALLASEKLATAGRLAATIAHEIHNPLDSVSNLLYLIQTGDSAEENAEFVELARTELDRATQISRSLLGMYRESRTAVSLDLSELLDSILLLLQWRFLQARVRVERNFAPSAIVTGFPVELRQVFTNLLANAADASPAGTTVTVTTASALSAASAESGASRQSGILTTILDQGVGIPAEVQARLFEPFFSTKGEAGTGLGLWVSKGIVQRHEGTIELVSSTEVLNHGTAISVFLPCHDFAPAEAEVSSDPGEILLPEHVRTAPERSA